VLVRSVAIRLQSLDLLAHVVEVPLLGRVGAPSRSDEDDRQKARDKERWSHPRHGANVLPARAPGQFGGKSHDGFFTVRD
jgi:hypothetical protein